MTIDINALRNKQRILIGGNHGLEKISKLISQVLESTGKSFHFLENGIPVPASSAVVFLKGGNELIDGSPLFHQFQPHILVLFKVSKKTPEGYDSFESYVGEVEKLANTLPKAGTFIFNQSDNVSLMIGKNDREDVKAIEFSALEGKKTNSGYLLTYKNDPFEVITDNENFLDHAAAAKALLNRIGVSDDQFYAVLKTLAHA
ncbi:hypothetical protein [Marinoscillum sp. MHG1-6]|uniref:hypothetical protein n=1 Tax=Marinoscillum sp. MHG1-6 TaxID=2959627 RepID=UPI002157AA8E|nr:hypothetical protein [Marinoscillum sp. MHG1-6]